MNGYAWPTDAGWTHVGVGGSVALLLGALLARARPGVWMRALAWAWVGVVVASGPPLTAADRAGTRMLLLCWTLFLALKALVQAEARLAQRPVPHGLTWLAFALLWPGMRPWAFAGPWGASRRGAGGEVARGLGVVALAALLLVGARALGTEGPREAPAVLLALAAIGLALPFGSFRALAGFWRWCGAPVALLFDAPFHARSLEEFWARRWNRAFSEMLQLVLRRPLARALGVGGAAAVCFLASGLLHEYALSVPARAGYGLPLLYFTLHGALVLAERRAYLQARPEALRRLWTLGWVVLPVGLVFHPPVLAACVRPLLE